MFKTVLTVGLNDKNTEKQEVSTQDAKIIIADTLINKYGVYAFTMLECTGVYKMDSTGNIIQETSFRIEIATDDAFNYSNIVNALKFALNQESIMVETCKADIDFI